MCIRDRVSISLVYLPVVIALKLLSLHIFMANISSQIIYSHKNSFLMILEVWKSRNFLHDWQTRKFSAPNIPIKTTIKCWHNNFMIVQGPWLCEKFSWSVFTKFNVLFRYNTLNSVDIKRSLFANGTVIINCPAPTLVVLIKHGIVHITTITEVV